MALHLPKPHVGKLNDHFILGEIIDHVSLVLPAFPDVDVLELRRQLNAHRKEQANPQQRTRGFLQAFQHTTGFQNAFGQMDHRMKGQLQAFIDGKLAEDVVKDGSLHTRPYPTTKYRSRLSGFFDFLFRVEQNVGRRLANVFEGKGCPVIYEDVNQTKVMEVSIHVSVLVNLGPALRIKFFYPVGVLR